MPKVLIADIEDMMNTSWLFTFLFFTGTPPLNSTIQRSAGRGAPLLNSEYFYKYSSPNWIKATAH